MASSSKTFLLLGFMFALVILISSEVSARELVETASQVASRPYFERGPVTGYRSPPPPPGEYRHDQGHHEKPGLGVAETETGN
ncbi:hypothetical protein PRUPE_4G226000 [Prunus persica]|uniref:Glycine-rich protein n=1 Tax=Prunus persica TaxID=3760 RepID=M5WN27_PRUPE|nr:hypothetical protein PRUPE_4G226000 [Prunus persica]